MKPRLALGRFLIRAGRFVQSLSLMAMRPGDLVESTRRAYSRPDSIEGWAEDKIVEAGLSEAETALLEHVPFRKGKCLVLGVGGGREALALARMGFGVTGLDFVPNLVARANENARARNLAFEGLVQDMTRLDVPSGTFDVVCLLAGTYSSVPTSRARLAMLGRVREALRPGGYFICQFLGGTEEEFGRAGEFLRRAFAVLTLGDLSYERGDKLAPNGEFLHVFGSEGELRSEFERAGLEVVALNFATGTARGGAVTRKLPQ